MTGVYRDKTRGHFRHILTDEPGWTEREAVGSDLGPVLDIQVRGHLTPDEARTLAESILWWADRKQTAVNPA